MMKVLTIARTEFLKHLRKPSFWFVLVLIPAVMGFMSLSNGSGSGNSSDSGIPGMALPEQTLAKFQSGEPVINFIDQSGLVPSVPAALPAETAALFQRYDSEPVAQAALDSAAIDSYYVIPADYLESGDIVRYSRDFDPFGGALEGDLMQLLLTTSLLPDPSPEVARALLQPTAGMTIEPLESNGQAAVKSSDERMSSVFQLGMMFTMLLYGSIFISASWLLQALIEEKENRVIEVVLSSVTSQQLLAGKIIGLGLLGLLELVIWGAAASVFLGGKLSFLPSLKDIDLAPTVWVLVAVCFACGYAIYGSLMAGIGALANTMRESSQLSIVMAVPVMLPLFFMSVIVTQPNGVLSTVLSIVPFTAPIVLVVRAAIGSLPLWLLGTSLLLMVGTVLGMQWLAARMFRSQNLLGDLQPSWKSLGRALRG